MSISSIKDQLGDYAKDIRLNLSNLFNNIEQAGMTPVQFYGTALSVAYTLKNNALIDMIITEAGEHLGEKEINAAKVASTLMAMNNIYYRFVHLVSDKEYGSMPANLRMSQMMNSGVSQVDFEIFSLAISAINGCGLCIDSHVKQLEKHSVSKQTIQTSIRLAATLNAADQALAI
ncbi:carboxymuconolactone decarboxylase family protein [Algicola sagamiensis]|uniref:carboxymuconolactone decarboxylase family protein n=1 Tax=Algicola sagamiensis TaxID=163869 RepID=UPI00038273DA|nr:carboxymuconolactone decarboxylase family protein [Algicola sagamiensis]